jgi:hypothetical protein
MLGILKVVATKGLSDAYFYASFILLQDPK